MPKTDKWVTWHTWQRVRTGHRVTKLETERQPTGYTDYWPATKEEIAVEVKRRSDKQKDAKRREQFESRQDYKDAQAIRAALEWISVDNHGVLDSLTPMEWAVLRGRLRA